MDVVLDTDASPPRPVNPRFDRYYRTGPQGRLRGARKTRRFMHFKPESVTQAVPERLAIPAPFNVAPSEAVGLSTRHSDLNRVGCDMIGVSDNLVYVPLFWRRLTQHESPCHIGAISAMLGPEVDKEELSAIHDP